MIVLQRPRGVRLLFLLRGSILGRIAPALATCTAFAVAVTLTRGLLFQGKVTLTPVPFSLVGLALAIFLGFRNGAAYERYWEARKLWVDLDCRSRTLARQAQRLLNVSRAATADDVQDPRARIVRRTIVFAHALRSQVRLEARELAWLPPHEQAAFLASHLGTEYLPRRMAVDLGASLRTRLIEPCLGAQIDSTLSGLSAVAAGCERIRSTPIPLVYTLLLHRTAWLYCFLLPFGLIDTIGPMTPLVVAFVAYTFFGLDAVGDEIEDPFGLAPHHLPLDAIRRTIERNLLEALGATDLPPALLPVDARLT